VTWSSENTSVIDDVVASTLQPPRISTGVLDDERGPPVHQRRLPPASTHPASEDC
jgi:hypothetical protein